MGATEDEITEVLLAIAPVIGLGRMVGAVAASRARSGTTSRRAGGPRWSVTVPQARRAKRSGQSYPPVGRARNARHEQQAYPISDFRRPTGMKIEYRYSPVPTSAAATGEVGRHRPTEFAELGSALLLLAVAAAARPVPTVFMITKDPGCPDDHFFRDHAPAAACHGAGPVRCADPSLSTSVRGGYLPPGSITHIVIVIPWWHPRTLGCWRAGDGAIVALWLLAAVREWPGVSTLGSVMSMAAAGSPGGLHDQLCDLVRVGDQRQVAGIDLDRRGVHAVGKEALKLGRRRAILPGDGIPGRL